MMTIKRYFLYVVMFNSFCLVAMDSSVGRLKEDVCADEVCDKIDNFHLGMSKYVCFKGIVGSCLSWFKSSFLTKKQITSEMNKIESYITLESKELILRKVAARHWYVHYLIQALINEKVKEIEEVTGYTLDKVCNPVKEEGLKRMIHKDALLLFFADKRIRTAPMDELVGKKDMHVITLYGNKDAIEPKCLAMSSNGKYLRAIDKGNNRILWDMKTARMGNFSGKTYENIDWVSADIAFDLIYTIQNIDLIYKKKIHRVEVGDYYASVDCGMKSLKDSNNPKAIVLIKRPQEISYLCQKAFNKSVNNHRQLCALRDSKTIQAVEGFPQNNLKELIANQLT